jgi:hypothetical protein
MCQFRSIIVTEKDVLSISNSSLDESISQSYDFDSDSHESIIEKYNLIDNKLPPTFARVEVIPINDIFSTNPDDWYVKVDQSITPKWWVPEYHEELCKEYVIKDLEGFRQTKIWKGDLNLSYCTSLITLPENLTVKGNLYLIDCTSLTTLPKNLTVKGYLDLSGCTSLTTLPENLTIELYLNLYNCTSLTTLPENLNVKGSIDLYNCTSLTTLPENLTVKGYLDLRHCTSLITLPENLTVKGNLDLSYCTNLTTLPKNLTVEGDLYLR